MSFEEKEMRAFAIALALALTLTLFQYPERDLNPHNRNGHRILSPACLPFHHPGNRWCKVSKFVLPDGGMAPLQSGCSLKTPTGCFIYARPYHPGLAGLGVCWSCGLAVNQTGEPQMAAQRYAIKCFRVPELFPTLKP